MHGTLVCAVTEGEENDHALALAVDVTNRLGLRLVLAHIVDGIAAVDAEAGDESVTMKAERQSAARRVADLVRDHGIADTAEQRVAVGEPAALLGQIASEEAADVIVVGARPRGWWRRGFDSRLARELETETPVPVLVAPPQARRAQKQRSTSAARR